MRPLKKIAAAVLLLLLLLQWCSAQVKINEVMINDNSTDDSTYVELFGSAGTILNGYQLVGVNGYNGSIYATIELFGAIPTDGFYVIGETAAVTNVDQVDSLVDFQNGPDNIQLLQGSTLIDAVGYGTFVSPDTFFAGEGEPSPNQVPNSSLCRFPDGQDSGNNSVDFTLSPILTPGQANDLGGEAPFYTLLELRTNPPDTSVVFWTTGIASTHSSTFGGTSNLSAYMQDDQAGINIFSSTGSFTFAPGDCLWVKSRWSEYNGLLELYYPLELHLGPNVGEPEPISINVQIANANGEALESMLVLLEEVWITASSAAWPATGENANLTITDDSGEDLVLRIDKDTDLDGWTEAPEVGEHFRLMAVLNQFGSVYQALPRSQADIQDVIGVLPEKLPGIPTGFALEAPYPNPFNPVASIRFSLPTRGSITLEVYNVGGGLVSYLANGYYDRGSYEITWAANGLTSGLYIIKLKTSEGVKTAKALLLR